MWDEVMEAARLAAERRAYLEGRDMLVVQVGNGAYVQASEVREPDDPGEVVMRCRSQVTHEPPASFSDLDLGDGVLVDGEEERVTRVTKLLFQTTSERRFLRSDGSGYGDEEAAATLPGEGA